MIRDKTFFLSKIKSTPGKVFNSTVLNDDLLVIKGVYSVEGYAFADVTPLTDIKQEEKKVNLTYSVEKGEKTIWKRLKSPAISGPARTSSAASCASRKVLSIIPRSSIAASRK